MTPSIPDIFASCCSVKVSAIGAVLGSASAAAQAGSILLLARRDLYANPAMVITLDKAPRPSTAVEPKHTGLSSFPKKSRVSLSRE
jgi:hypothetical protein